MKALPVLAILVIAALTTTGCGKSYKKLTDEQKAQVKESMSSMGRTVTAVQSRGNANGLRELNLLNARSVLLAGNESIASPKVVPTNTPAATSTSTPVESDDTSEKMSEEFKSVEGACDVNVSTSSMAQASSASASGVGSLDLKVTATGDACPATMDFSVKGSSSSDQKADISFIWKYEVKKDTFRKLNDIDKVDVKGSVSAELPDPKALASASKDASATTQEGKLKADLSGTIHSQKNGDLKFAISGDFSGSRDGKTGESKASGTMAMTLDYNDFGAEFKVKFDDKKVEYFLNNEKSSKEEFTEYLKKFPFFNTVENSIPESDISQAQAPSVSGSAN